MLKKIWNKIVAFSDRYPVVLYALAIYLYYLVSSLNVFRHGRPETFTDYFFQYDSLFFMWIAAAALLQLRSLRKASKKDEERRHEVERALDRQQIHERLINDITMLLQDNVNNPLAVISVTTREIRRKFEKDIDIIKWLDRIESSIQRIHNTIRDIQAYEANKILQETATALKDTYQTQENKTT